MLQDSSEDKKLFININISITYFRFLIECVSSKRHITNLVVRSFATAGRGANEIVYLHILDNLASVSDDR